VLIQHPRDTRDLLPLWLACFPEDTPAQAAAFFSMSEQTFWAIYQHDQPIAMLLTRPHRVWVRGRAVAAQAIAGVCTHPAHRGRGLAHKLLTHAILTAREDHVPLQFLDTHLPGVYTGCGFARAAQRVRVLPSTPCGTASGAFAQAAPQVGILPPRPCGNPFDEASQAARQVRVSPSAPCGTASGTFAQTAPQVGITQSESGAPAPGQSATLHTETIAANRASVAAMLALYDAMTAPYHLRILRDIPAMQRRLAMWQLYDLPVTLVYAETAVPQNERLVPRAASAATGAEPTLPHTQSAATDAELTLPRAQNAATETEKTLVGYGVFDPDEVLTEVVCTSEEYLPALLANGSALLPPDWCGVATGRQAPTATEIAPGQTSSIGNAQDLRSGQTPSIGGPNVPFPGQMFRVSDVQALCQDLCTDADGEMLLHILDSVFGDSIWRVSAKNKRLTMQEKTPEAPAPAAHPAALTDALSPADQPAARQSAPTAPDADGPVPEPPPITLTIQQFTQWLLGAPHALDALPPAARNPLLVMLGPRRNFLFDCY